jgi:hypothetical protein
MLYALFLVFILVVVAPLAALWDLFKWSSVARQTRPSDKYYAEQLRLQLAQLTPEQRLEYARLSSKGPGERFADMVPLAWTMFIVVIVVLMIYSSLAHAV